MLALTPDWCQARRWRYNRVRWLAYMQCSPRRRYFDWHRQNNRCQHHRRRHVRSVRTAAVNLVLANLVSLSVTADATVEIDASTASNVHPGAATSAGPDGAAVAAWRAQGWPVSSAVCPIPRSAPARSAPVSGASALCLASASVVFHCELDWCLWDCSDAWSCASFFRG